MCCSGTFLIVCVLLYVLWTQARKLLSISYLETSVDQCHSYNFVQICSINRNTHAQGCLTHAQGCLTHAVGWSVGRSVGLSLTPSCSENGIGLTAFGN
jgi:hypothetical protein